MIISPLKTNRIEWIDTIKGICIILVIIYHTCGLPIIGQFLFGGFMGTFFILSGYTTKKDIISSGIKKNRTTFNSLFFLWNYFNFIYNKQSNYPWELGIYHKIYWRTNILTIFYRTTSK